MHTKVILSRKGFDSSNGGIPSPIMPDGTLLSMPILDTSGISFSDIAWNGISYVDILKQLKPDGLYVNCHVDPDIRENRVKSVKGWKPAFGQMRELSREIYFCFLAGSGELRKRLMVINMLRGAETILIQVMICR